MTTTYLVSCNQPNKLENKLLSKEGEILKKKEELNIEQEKFYQKEKTNVLTNKIIIPGQKVGPITITSTEKELIELFGKENVQNAVVYSDEGNDVNGTEIIFANPENNIYILWKDVQRLSPNIVYIRGGDWRTKEGIRVGSTIKDIENINGKSFLLNTFETCFSPGTVATWNNGSLDGTYINMEFEITTELSDEAALKMAAEGQYFTSRNKSNLKVKEILIGF